MRISALSAAVFLLMRVHCAAADAPASHAGPPPSIPIPLRGSLLTVWSWGPNDRSAPWALTLTNASGTHQVLPVADANDSRKPWFARWRSREEAIVEVITTRADSQRHHDLVRLQANSGETTPLLDRGGLVAVSPDGRKMLLETVDWRGHQSIETWSIDPLSKLAKRAQSGTDFGSMASARWNPASTKIAASLLTDIGGKLVPRLALLSADLGEPSWIEGISADRAGRGTTLLFWDGADLWAWDRRQLIRCAVSGAGCTDVYDPGKGRTIMRGVYIGDHKAMLLVSDQRENRLEIRAKEFHVVDLTTGTGNVVLRAPGDAFAWDIDWVE